MLEGPDSTLNETLSANKMAVVTDFLKGSEELRLDDAGVDYMDL